VNAAILMPVTDLAHLGWVLIRQLANLPFLKKNRCSLYVTHCKVLLQVEALAVILKLFMRHGPAPVGSSKQWKAGMSLSMTGCGRGMGKRGCAWQEMVQQVISEVELNNGHTSHLRTVAKYHSELAGFKGEIGLPWCAFARFFGSFVACQIRKRREEHMLFSNCNLLSSDAPSIFGDDGELVFSMHGSVSFNFEYLSELFEEMINDTGAASEFTLLQGSGKVDAMFCCHGDGGVVTSVSFDGSEGSGRNGGSGISRGNSLNGVALGGSTCRKLGRARVRKSAPLVGVLSDVSLVEMVRVGLNGRFAHPLKRWMESEVGREVLSCGGGEESDRPSSALTVWEEHDAQRYYEGHDALLSKLPSLLWRESIERHLWDARESFMEALRGCEEECREAPDSVDGGAVDSASFLQSETTSVVVAEEKCDGHQRKKRRWIGSGVGRQSKHGKLHLEDEAK
jgi:hypothetical protein